MPLEQEGKGIMLIKNKEIRYTPSFLLVLF